MPVKGPSFVMIDGRRMTYEDVRPAAPAGTVLLLAGADSNRLIWYRQLDVFGRALRTIALDYRDTGESDPVSDPYTIADLADDGALVLVALGVQRASVVGISLGGYVALQMALRHPALVEKLVLVSTSETYIPPSPGLLAQIQSLQGDPQLEVGERMQRVLALLTAPGYFAHHPDDWDQFAEWARYRPQSQAAADRQMQAALTYDVSGQLDRIQVPTLVVHGELDRRVLPESGRSLAQHITGPGSFCIPRLVISCRWSGQRNSTEMYWTFSRRRALIVHTLVVRLPSPRAQRMGPYRGLGPEEKHSLLSPPFPLR